MSKSLQIASFVLISTLILLFQNCSDIQVAKLSSPSTLIGGGALPVQELPFKTELDLGRIGYFDETVGFTADRNNIYKYGLVEGQWAQIKTYDIFENNPAHLGDNFYRHYQYLGSTKKHSFFCSFVRDNNTGTTKDDQQSILVYKLNNDNSNNEKWDLETEYPAYCWNFGSNHNNGVTFNEKILTYRVWADHNPRKYVTYSNDQWSGINEFFPEDLFETSALTLVNDSFAIREIQTTTAPISRIIKVYKYENSFELTDSFRCEDHFSNCSPNNNTWDRRFFAHKDQVIISESKSGIPEGNKFGVFKISDEGKITLTQAIFTPEENKEPANFPNFHISAYRANHISVKENFLFYVTNSVAGANNSLNVLKRFNLTTGLVDKEITLASVSDYLPGNNPTQVQCYTNGNITVVSRSVGVIANGLILDNTK